MTYSATRSAHEVISHSATMLARTGAGTVADTEDLADLAGQCGDDFLRAAHGSGLACADGGDARSGEATGGGGARETALEFRGAWAQACCGVARSAGVGETTVSTAAACSFGAASDIVGEA